MSKESRGEEKRDNDCTFPRGVIDSGFVQAGQITESHAGEEARTSTGFISEPDAQNSHPN